MRIEKNRPNLCSGSWQTSCSNGIDNFLKMASSLIRAGLIEDLREIQEKCLLLICGVHAYQIGMLAPSTVRASFASTEICADGAVTNYRPPEEVLGRALLMLKQYTGKKLKERTLATLGAAAMLYPNVQSYLDAFELVQRTLQGEKPDFGLLDRGLIWRFYSTLENFEDSVLDYVSACHERMRTAGVIVEYQNDGPFQRIKFDEGWFRDSLFALRKNSTYGVVAPELYDIARRGMIEIVLGDVPENEISRIFQVQKTSKS
ncbi:hypothetical protein GNI_134420 [Gregarina niphandrodes]|uniref:Uncharacterized protein n=1 Tax=Gregarina niphandrodes TaxID=110365 RepID=A0A023B118_GRENI|nr:hypothetical protein GNI_134420 [Gregarina niphandrodes]EZG46267.1 hypothetical protein GNI_134420 [Gregarina niphandrodes]|eukprot:XP_011132337.1 hypothetical protein GNI_134420 [Gregarina niphandrodes]